MRKTCYTCRAPLGVFDRVECGRCRDKAWRERSRPSPRVPVSREVLFHEVGEALRRGAARATAVEEFARASLHEAAHAVAALDLGGTVVEVRVDGRGGGETVRSGPAPGAVALAGPLAELRWFGDPGGGCDGDEARAVTAWESGEGVDVATVEDILTRRADHIQAVACALQREGRLSGGDVEAIVRSVDAMNAAGDGDSFSTVDAEVRSGGWESRDDASPGWLEQRSSSVPPAPGWVRNGVHGGWEPSWAGEVRRGARTRTFAWSAGGCPPGCDCGSAA